MFENKFARYAPQYCEENIWHLCQHPNLLHKQRYVVFISNKQRLCPFWNQRAATSAEAPVGWDYHVVMLLRHEDDEPWCIGDLDTRLEFPTPVADYLRQTFVNIDNMPSEYHPTFRVIPATEYVERFSSDRSHMRSVGGGWLAPPPSWPAIHSGPSNLDDFINVETLGVGNVMTLDAFRAFDEPPHAGVRSSV
jgi:hypothetical protein